MMARRISGSDGCGGGALGDTLFPPTPRLQAPGLQIGKGDAGRQRVPMQTGPGPAFEVAEPELLLELLTHLLARPARLDAGHQPPQCGLLRQVTDNWLRVSPGRQICLGAAAKLDFQLLSPDRVKSDFLEGRNGWKPPLASDSHASGARIA